MVTKQYSEHHKHRLVLEAWERLEGVEIGNPLSYRQETVVRHMIYPWRRRL
jgi:hypothetical protein